MAKKLNSMRLLEAQNIPYDMMRFPATIHSAQAVADHFDVPASQVYKTLVLLTSQDKPLLVMIAADQEIELKRLAQALGEKKLRMATQSEAETLTGLQVGGISALALRQRHFPVYLNHTAAAVVAMLISAGRRGVNLRLKVADVIRATDAVFVEATRNAQP